MKNHKKTCVFCGGTFISQRKDAKTCSSTCRVHLHHQNKAFRKNKSVLNTTFNVSEIKTPVLNKEINVSADSLNISMNSEGFDYSHEFIEEPLSERDPVLYEWIKYCEEEDRAKAKLPYIEELCALCHKPIKVSKNFNSRGREIVCDNCITFYHVNYLLKRNIRNTEGLTVDEAYSNLPLTE